MINGPFDNDRGAEKAYFDHTASIRYRDEPDSRLVQQGLAPHTAVEIKEKQEAMAQAQKAQRAYELTHIAENIEHLRQRLLIIGKVSEAQVLDTVVVSLMQSWMIER